MPHAKAGKKAMSYKNDRANLPQDVKHENYPKREYPLGQSGYPDDINMMDANYNKDAKKIARSKSRY